MGGMRGGLVRAWRRQWAAFGRDADRNEIPANARPSRPPPRILSDASLPRGDGPHGHVGAGGLCSDVVRRVAIRCRVVVKTIGARRWEALDRITTRHAASLRPSRNGRIGFKPPYSKGEPSQKPRMGSILYGEGFPPLQ